ncbi:MFS transporter [Terriglobus tenax]|uniref:MFS transporter n=1 Tax=Terriglobus tenax TaxID=1111115 RepID=UPI0021DFF6ED|nr:MFS transporter [Terriglobus tenax]
MSDSSQRRSSAASAFRSRNFRFYQAARLLGILGAEAQTIAVAWQVYQITHKAIDLGYTGLALFLPGIFFALVAGHVADRYDRRNVIRICYILQAVCTTALLWVALTGTRNVLFIYAVLFLIGTGRAFSGPASSALVPQLVPKDDFFNAVTWGATFFQIANAAGPALGGILFTLPLTGTLAPMRGAPIVYCFTIIGLLSFVVLISMVKPQGAPAGPKNISLKTVLAGLDYLWCKKLLLGSISLDLFAVLLGGAVSLMPIFAEEILHAGPAGLGMLRAAPSVGALTISLLLTVRPIRHSAGKKMLSCVAIYGVATIVFGLSKSLWLSLAALAVVGASDMVSVVVRSSLLQMATPPEMRGRVSAVNWLFLGASNEFGEFESGVTAQWLGAVRAVVIGGVLSLTVTGLWSVLFKPLRDVDQLSAEELLPVHELQASSEPVE